MVGLEIAASVAEIIAGLAILGTAIKAWPIFSGMEARLIDQRRTSRLVADDIDRFADAIARTFDVDVPSREPRALVRELLTVLEEHGGIDVDFEFFPSLDPLPGRISYKLSGGALGELRQRPEFVRLTSDGYRLFVDTICELAGLETRSGEEYGYIAVGKLRYRIHVAHSISGPIATLGLAPSRVFKVEDLGVDEPWWPIVRDLLDQSGPFALVCAGGVGTGKATMATSLVEYASRTPARKIVTVEYPVDFILDGVTQISCETGGQLERTYESAIRQNPDFIYLAAAGCGAFIWNSYGRDLKRQVLANITALDAAAGFQMVCREARDGLKSIDAPFVMLGQQLSRLLCQDCRVQHPLTREDEALVQQVERRHQACDGHDQIGRTFFEAGEGCRACQSGYRGRIAVIEAMEVTQDLLDLADQSARVIRGSAIEAGMASISFRALQLANAGRIGFSDLKKIVAEYDG